MTKIDLEIAIKIIRNLKNDWVLCDDNDTFDYFTLVDNNRMVNKLKPKKILIEQMIQENYIATTDKFEKREYMQIMGEKIPLPFVYDFDITDKGKALYK